MEMETLTKMEGMKMQDQKQNLQNVVDNQIATISPLRVQSEQLLEQAKEITVETADDVRAAKSLIKDITAHKKSAEEMRKAYTRQLDDVKKQFIAAERDVLEPADQARELLAQRILGYERAEEERKQAEEQRIKERLKTILDGVQHEKITTPAQADEALGKIDTDVVALGDDAKHPIAIDFIGRLRARIMEIKAEVSAPPVTAEDEARQQLEADKARLQAEKARKEAEAAARREANAAPKTGSRERIIVEIVNPDLVPRELCLPSEQLIKNYAKETGNDNVAGCIIKRERVL